MLLVLLGLEPGYQHPQEVSPWHLSSIVQLKRQRTGQSRERCIHCGQTGMSNKAVEQSLAANASLEAWHWFWIEREARGEHKQAVLVKVWDNHLWSDKVPAPESLERCLTSCQTCRTVFPRDKFLLGLAPGLSLLLLLVRFLGKC